MNKRLWWSGLVVVSLALVACSGDDSGDQPVAGTGGAAAAGIGGGGGGVGGASGVGGGGGAAGMMAMPVPCGTNTCQPLGGGIASMIPGLGAAIPPPCCLDEAMGTCGLMTGGTCMPPAMSDPRCPPANFAGMMVPSCCTPAGVCGINASQLGFGCIDPGMFTGQPGMACDGAEDGGVDGEDAGS